MGGEEPSSGAMSEPVSLKVALKVGICVFDRYFSDFPEYASW
jgi:hypothetical protein